ncbi:MAG: hypothetical protein WCA35_02305 [Kovacikia sp.]
MGTNRFNLNIELVNPVLSLFDAFHGKPLSLSVGGKVFEWLPGDTLVRFNTVTNP